MCFYNEVWEFFTTDKAVFFVNTQFHTYSVFNDYNIYLQAFACMISHSAVHFFIFMGLYLPYYVRKNKTANA